MIQRPISDNGHNRSFSNQTLSNNSREFKKIELKSQKTNFLYDVIMPKTLDIENIRIIKKYSQANSPQTISKRVVQMKKSKIQKKIQSIVTKNTEDAIHQMNNVQRVTNYTKQNVKRESKFAQNEKYKKSLFEEQLPVQKMKLFYEGTNSFSPIKNLNHINNCIDDITEEQKPSPFVIDMDEKLGEKRLMQQQVFEPLKQKIKKVIDKTINTGVNGKINGLMEKINFYLTSITKTPNKQKIKRVIVDVHKGNEKIKSYCEEIQKGRFIKTQNLKISKLVTNDPQLKQYRSKSSLMKTRPLTAGFTYRTAYSERERTLTSSKRTASASRLNRFTKSSSEFNIKQKPSRTQTQNKHMDQLLNEIQSTCQQSNFNNKVISKRMEKMSSQWDIDGKGIRICENKRIVMTEGTLEMLKRIRMKAPQIQEIEKQLMEKDQ